MPQFPVQYSGVPVAGSSSQPLQPVVALPAFSPSISRGITQIVNELPRWEQQAARAEIETKLRSMPADEQQTLLMHLNTRLSGKASDTKPAVIRNWAATDSVATVIEGRDMRTDRERELQTALADQNSNPDFRISRDEVLGMLRGAQRRAAMHIGIGPYGTGTHYVSVLYWRVFRDSRGPVAAINDIRDLIAPLNEQQRYQAIKDWIPRYQDFFRGVLLTMRH
ncbi:hypothetical protein G3N58_12315 [Paraburkholderia sp. Ac-20342]|uniref:hypothetical protein n=1 Tax=Paraburkholderia sp. Ac-20342 TaxID=2703889 RepID=UPI00197E788E|nr:hypothetical protein [Paraburkholderia sp. Ac-20342]MBN3847606.1 hypothetical protein [Paraburkholderia sp. Ac-20342]